MTDDRVDALRRALDFTPDNHALRMTLAQSLQETGALDEAQAQLRQLVEAGAAAREELLAACSLALRMDAVELAGALVDVARTVGVVEGVSALQDQIDERLARKGVLRLVPRGPEVGASLPTSIVSPAHDKVSFGDVGGLADVKKTIHRMIILPLQRPDLYEKYGRQRGGGVMLYGPPGCGKTLLARATAGECGLPFFTVRIEEILDPWMGVSERNLHDAFEQARAQAPCVLFIDELDGLAYARRKQHGSAARALVDQMLHELDSVGARNTDLLVLGATNAPWDVDEALKRPGRFDRLIFVPPPDLEARKAILTLGLRSRPTRDLEIDGLARATPLWSGADLRALVERAVDEVIEEALDSGAEPPLTMRHLERARENTRPTTIDWLSSAANYVEFANEGDRYREVAQFLRSREAKSVRKRGQ